MHVFGYELYIIIRYVNKYVVVITSNIHHVILFIYRNPPSPHHQPSLSLSIYPSIYLSLSLLMERAP